MPHLNFSGCDGCDVVRAGAAVAHQTSVQKTTRVENDCPRRIPAVFLT
jgi:hypothetical protein